MTDDQAMPGDDTFRTGVGAMILDAEGRILQLRRTDVKTESWQLPQGGMRASEEPEAALLREVQEETGLAAEDYQILEASAEWIGYELPRAYRSRKTGRGQVHKWFLCRLTVEDSRIRADGSEFDAWRWVRPDDLLTDTVDFRLPVYRRLLETFASHLSLDGGSRKPPISCT